MPADIDVVVADAADAEAVADLWVDLATDQRRHGSHLRAAPNRTTMRETLARHAVDGRLRIAVDDGIVGFVRYGFEQGHLDTDGTRGVVRDIYVRPERRREGIGSALLDAAESDLRERGATTVALESLADNAAARRFYERHGYRTHRVEFEKPADSKVETTKRSGRDR
jgi:ribosomal protein S18 acetylase RimI-like enzyme